MSGPVAAVRHTIGRWELDEAGFLAPASLRRLRAKWEDIPAGASVCLDLGALDKVDSGLIAALSRLPRAPRLHIESADWRLAEAATLDLVALLGVD